MVMGGQSWKRGVAGQKECPTMYACIHRDKHIDILPSPRTHKSHSLSLQHSYINCLSPRAPELPLGVNLIVLQSEQLLPSEAVQIEMGFALMGLGKPPLGIFGKASSRYR